MNIKNFKQFESILAKAASEPMNNALDSIGLELDKLSEKELYKIYRNLRYTQLATPGYSAFNNINLLHKLSNDGIEGKIKNDLVSGKIEYYQIEDLILDRYHFIEIWTPENGEYFVIYKAIDSEYNHIKIEGDYYPETDELDTTVFETDEAKQYWNNNSEKILNNIKNYYNKDLRFN
jgi:hypothetical protein